MQPPLVRAAVMAALFFTGSLPAVSRTAHLPVALIRHDNVPIYSRPSPHASVVTVAVQQTQVQVNGHEGTWSHVALWASVWGWVRSADLVFRAPWHSVSSYRPPQVRYHVHAYPSRAIRAAAVTTSPVVLRMAPNGASTGTIPDGTRVTATAWQQDGLGRIWYQTRRRWVLGDSVQFQTPDPGRSSEHGQRLWQTVSGKGMWLTLGTIAASAPDALVQAARRNGLTHLYLESAISPLGFHAKAVVGPLIDAAHRHHLAVIAWVYPYLYDLAADVDLTRRVAAFRTSSGQAFDGIAADIERNMTLAAVRGYSQLVRAYLGPKYLLVGVTYPPQSIPSFPFAEVAHNYNVIAPMDYWHQTPTSYGMDYGHMPYGAGYAYRYAADSVRAIRRVSGDVPVAPIGQTFDDFGRLEMGPHAPSADEIQGFLAGCKASGAAGVSFFQWMTAEVAEWQSIQRFRY